MKKLFSIFCAIILLYGCIQKNTNTEIINIFDGISYYNHQMHDRYLNYLEKNPEILIEDVVWQVNVGIDLGHFDNANDIIDIDKFPILVNKNNRLPRDFIPKDLVPMPSKRLVTSETYKTFIQMQKDAKSDGYNIDETSAYRSIDKQISIYNRYLEKDENADIYSARPRFSEHHLGTAIDLLGAGQTMTKFGKTKEYQWILENAHKYGFIQRYKQNQEHITGYMPEEWHITYVGIEIATYMKNNNIETLEEYIGKNI